MPKKLEDITDPNMPVTRYQCSVNTSQIIDGQGRLETQIKGLVSDTRELGRVTTEKLSGIDKLVAKIDKAQAVHEARHKGGEVAAGHGMARMSAWSTLARVVLVALALLASGIAYVTISGRAVTEKTPADIELLNDVRAIKTTLAELRKAGP